MDLTLAQIIDTLRKAEDALRSEMEVRALAETGIDDARLGSLGEMAHSFQQQAHSALVMMCYEDVPASLPQEVDALIAAFGEIAGQIQAMLASDKREILGPQVRDPLQPERTDATLTDRSKAAEARAQVLEEAAAEARRLAKEWQDEAEGTHSSHQSELRRTWSDAAERVAAAIAALAQPGQG
jgi:uncharacterized protein YukE